MPVAVADPDFELRSGPGSILLAQPAFLPSVIFSFFTQNKGELPPLGPSPRSATGKVQMLEKTIDKLFIILNFH